MDKLSVFKNMDLNQINSFLMSIGARKISFKKDHIIFSNLAENDLIGIMLNGTASIVKYDYFGNRDIIDNLEYDDIFGKPFSCVNNDISVIATSDAEVLFIDYNVLSSNNYPVIRENINIMLTDKINRLYEKIEILSKRTIKDKLLCYFSILAKKRNKKSFVLPITYLELSDYLSIDRSAMMREIKKLKDQKIISIDGKKITINN